MISANLRCSIVIGDVIVNISTASNMCTVQTSLHDNTTQHGDYPFIISDQIWSGLDSNEVILLRYST